MARPRFALVSPVLPLPADQGSRRFQLELARTLLQLGSVSWVTRAIGEQSAARAQLEAEGFGLHLDESFVRQDLASRLLRRARIDARAALWRRPRELAFTCTPRVTELVARQFGSQPDAIAVGAFWYSWRALRSVPRAQRVLVLSDVEHDRLSAAAALGLASEAQVARLRQAELEAIGQVALVLAICERDRELLEPLVRPLGTEVGLWPVAIPVPERPVAATKATEGKLRLLCYGRWEAAFNRDGLLDWMTSVWPTLRAAHPGVSVAVAGSGIDAGLSERLASAQLENLGWVEALPAELARTQGVIVPLRYAGGVRYRLLEAFAYGVPCIASPVAARGSGAQAGLHYLQAETPGEWVSAVSDLTSGPRAAGLAASARAFVQARYAGPSIVTRARAALQPVLPQQGLEA